MSAAGTQSPQHRRPSSPLETLPVVASERVNWLQPPTPRGPCPGSTREPESLVLDPSARAGKRVSIFWDGDDEWYSGTVLGHALGTFGLHQVVYDEDKGFTYEENLLSEATNVRFLESGAEHATGSASIAGRSTADEFARSAEGRSSAILGATRRGAQWHVGELLVVRGSASKNGVHALAKVDDPFWLAVVVRTKSASCTWIPVRWLQHSPTVGDASTSSENGAANTETYQLLLAPIDKIHKSTVLCRWGVVHNWTTTSCQGDGGSRVARRVCLTLGESYVCAAKAAIAANATATSVGVDTAVSSTEPVLPSESEATEGRDGTLSKSVESLTGLNYLVVDMCFIISRPSSNPCSVTVLSSGC